MQTLQKLMQFTQSIRAEKGVASAAGLDAEAPPVAAHAKETYRGQILDYSDSDNDDGEQAEKGSAAWHAGKLKFRKHVDDQYRNGKLDDYAVIDPRQR